jgi:hypothetical protein
MNSGNSSFVALTASVAGAASQSLAVANIDQLTYLQTNEKVWIGDKKIKKAITN